MSKSDYINHSALKFLIEADAVESVTAVAHADKWALKVKCGPREKTVVAKNSGKTRIWRKLDTLAKYLLDLGVHSFETDVSKYDPSRQTLRRPDSAAALKLAHSAHKRWTQEQKLPTPGKIQKIQNVSADEVRENWEKRRAKILQQANPRAK